MKLFHLLLLVSFQFFQCKQEFRILSGQTLKPNNYHNNIVYTDTIKGYFNLDEIEDYILVRKANKNILTCEIYLEKNKFKKAQTFKFDSTFSDLLYDYGIENLSLFYTGIKGQFGVQASCCASTKEYETKIYNYENENWVLYESYEHSFRPVSFNLLFSKEKYNIDFVSLEKDILNLFENKELLNSKYDLIYFGKILHNKVIINDNLSEINNIAYYLEQAEAYPEAILLLEKIIAQYPSRTVAYINLGDAYWGLNQHDKAKKSYNAYIIQMKEKNKESKIPQRVFKRAP